MFLKVKRDAQGKFEKMKSRLVGDGSKQDTSVYERKLESPTVEIQSVFIMLELASRRRMKATKIDFLAAYLNAKIDDGDKIIMWINK